MFGMGMSVNAEIITHSTESQVDHLRSCAASAAAVAKEFKYNVEV